ncbi:hypothetical protein BHM03_00014916 [Ensete ventricosum]|nr:hypothetical protein BHM03_00014916 [Ensete ventricosum]
MRAVKARVEGWRGWGRGRGKSGCCSFKRITVVVCCVNLVAALLLLRSFDTSFFLFPSYGFNGNPFSGTKMAPFSLKLFGSSRGQFLPQNVEQKLANEILQRLQGDNVDTNDRCFVFFSKSLLIHPSTEEIIPGRPLPPECHAELHTDYDGAAVRWGLIHHKESAADCCQACLDQAKRPKPGEKKCNIWVYCPSEFGCYSPDIYEHKHQECWLKQVLFYLFKHDLLYLFCQMQAERPRLNFKDKYSKSYRKKHPSAPIVVPWMSGVVGA